MGELFCVGKLSRGLTRLHLQVWMIQKENILLSPFPKELISCKNMLRPIRNTLQRI